MWRANVHKWTLPNPEDFGEWGPQPETPRMNPTPPNAQPVDLPEYGGEVDADGDTPMEAPPAPNPFGPVTHKPEEEESKNDNDNTNTNTDNTNNTGENEEAPVPQAKKMPRQEAKATDSALGAGALNINTIVDAQPESGIPITETRTVRHTWEGYFSVNNIQGYGEIASGIQNAWSCMNNNIYQPFVGVFVKQDPTTTPTFGLSVKMAPHRKTFGSADTNRNTRLYFPRTMVGADTQDIEVGIADKNVPTWLNWYRKMYKYYTPLKSRHKITISSNYFRKDTNDSACMHYKNTEIYIGQYTEDYVTSNTDDIRPFKLTFGQDPTTKSTASEKFLYKQDFDKFKGIKWYKLDYNTPQITIYTDWKAGEDAGSVRNLNDVKQWYNVGAAPDPMWNCMESFVALTGDYNTCLDTHGPCINVHVQSEWAVQYKGLVNVLKYQAEPTPQDQAIHLRLGIDNIQFPFTRGADWPKNVTDRTKLGPYGWQPTYTYA